MKPYIRRKGRRASGEPRYTIEQEIDGKVKVICTLPPVDELIKLTCPPEKEPNLSSSDEENQNKRSHYLH